MSELVLTEDLVRRIQREGEGAFPEECCGILFGRDVGEQRIVERLEAVSNTFEPGEQYHRFSILPEQLLKAEKAAGAEGRLVLGFYHSHPGHPARPSEYDREHAWPFYSYVIVSVMDGQAAEMTCWVLDERTEMFRPQPLVGC